MKRLISLLLVAALILSIPMMALSANAAAYTGLMRQYESQWANIYHNGGSLYNCGCGLFSLANAVGYLTGYQMDVVELADWAHANGMYNVTGADGTYRTSFYPAASKRYGSTYGFTIDCGSGSGYWSTASDARLKNHLIGGGTAIVHVSNHFICIVGYDTSTGKYHLYESAPDPYRGTNYNGGDVWFTESQLCSGYTDVDWFCLISATSGWKQNSKGWWYEYADGSYATGWAQIGSNWYYFDKNGYMQTGWQEIGGSWYYLEPEKGYMRTGWVYTGGNYYYMDSSGKMLTGWQEIEGNWYYLNTSDDSMPDGAMYTGWKEINGYWYYFNTKNDGTSGIMRTGWLQLGSKWYFLESSGKMLTGWRFINSKWYHLDEESGAMSTSDWICDEDTWYYVGADGVMTDGAEWNGVFEDGLDIGTDFYATIDIPHTGTRVGVDSDSNSDTYQNVEVQAVRAEDASDYNEQLWHFQRRTDDGSYRITNVATGMCLDQTDASIAAGTNVRVYAGNNAMAQRWFVFANGENHGLVSACSAWDMTVLDVQDNQGTEGTNIRIWSQNTSGAQKFAVTPISEPADPEPLPTINLVTPTLLLEDTIKLNIYFTVDQDIDLDKMGMITWTSQPSVVDISTADAVYPGATFNSGNGYYGVNTDGIPAQNLGDTIYFCIYAELDDGTIVYGKQVQYSPTQYAYNQLKGGATDDMKALLVAILNYGAAAQNYLGYNTDALVNANLTDDMKALVQAYSSSMVDSIDPVDSSKVGPYAATGGFDKKYPTVLLDGAFAINYHFTPSYTPDAGITLFYWTEADYNAATSLSPTNATGRITMTGSDEFEGIVEGIAAKDLGDTIYVVAGYRFDGVSQCTGVLPYSIGAFCVSQANSGDDLMKPLAQSIAVYGYYASIYFAQ